MKSFGYFINSKVWHTNASIQKLTIEMRELNPIARIVWKLARNHTWGQSMLEEDVIAVTRKDKDSDEMRANLEAALELPFLSSGLHGVYIPN